MRSLFFTLLFIILSCSILLAQPTQIIRGNITDASNAQPLVGATLSLLELDKGSVTDENGNFRFSAIPVGRYQLKVSYLGYQDIIIPEVLVESGKEAVLNLRMSPQAQLMEEVEVRATQEGQISLQPLSLKVMTIEQVQRFPAAFFDPARMASAFAGVVNTNDQANGLSIRGHSPNHVSWQLEGLPILNPNHTPNAGTPSDRMTYNSGGVNILSAQLLSTTQLFTGAFEAGYNNAIGGVMDMHLRTGNDEKYEFTAQAGLLGLDVAAEGPLMKNKPASFLANYRYSTVGLLTELGADFGGEAINFQDLSFHLNFPGKKGQRLTLFGMGGISSNRFTGKEDLSEVETDRDLFNIDFEASMGATGITWTQPVGNKGFFYAGAAFSATQQEREQRLVNDSLSFTFPANYLSDAGNLSLLTGHVYYQHKVNTSAQFKIGLQANQYQFNPTRPDGPEREITYGNIQPYFSFSSTLGAHWQYQIGLNAPYYESTEDLYIEPRLMLAYAVNPNHLIALAYGLHSQYGNPYQVLFPPDEFSPIRAHHVSLGYDWQIKPGLQFHAELFYHQLFDIPMQFSLAGLPVTPVTDINDFLVSQFVVDPSRTSSEAVNRGIELELNQLLTNGYYYLLNATFFRATLDYGTDEAFSSPFDREIATNATLGKEWIKAKSNEKTRVLGVNIGLNYVGGLLEGEINEVSSQLANYTIRANSFTERLPAYFRADLRIYLKKSRLKYNTMLALDLLNVTNRSNVSHRYYDIWLQRVEERNQLSLIPILTYRVEF